MVVTMVALGFWGHATHGEAGIAAAVLAVLVCWFSATAALVVAGRSAGTPNALNAQLASIGLRTVVPLVVAIGVEGQVPYIAQAGLFGMMVPAYLVSLVAETLLSIWHAGPTRSVAKAL